MMANRVKGVLGAIVLTTVALGSGASIAAMMAAFDKLAPLGSAELQDLRGGFAGSHGWISFGYRSSTYVDGALAQSVTLSPIVLGGNQAIVPVFKVWTPSGETTQTGNLAAAQTIPGFGGSTTITNKVTDTAIINMIQNSANHRSISMSTVTDIGLSSRMTDAMRNNLQNSLSHNALQNAAKLRR